LKHQQKYQINRNKKCFLSKKEKLLNNICIKKRYVGNISFCKIDEKLFFCGKLTPGKFDHKAAFMIKPICKKPVT